MPQSKSSPRSSAPSANVVGADSSGNTHLPKRGGFGKTPPVAHVPGDATDAKAGEAQLDDALRETFPASDPISPGAAAAQQENEAAPDTAGSTPEPSTAPIAFPTSESVAAADSHEADSADAAAGPSASAAKSATAGPPASAVPVGRPRRGGKA